ncbi:MAG: WD40-like protein Beta Propeller [uncultured bacterium]|nr:MAG: WD40-like protein Beta Propeller [uncultured bacterium]
MYNKILFLSLITILLFSNIVFAQTTNDITLKPGFNFISFTNLIALNPTELKALNTSIEDIFLFSSSAGSFLSASEGTLSTLSIGKGYIIKNNASSDIKISITGNAITLINPINLKTGFNLVGFSQASSTNTFEKFMTDNTIIKGCYKWSPTAGSFIQVLRNELGVINKIDGVDPTIKAGESYFFNMYGDSALTYDTTTISLSPASYDIPTPKVANPLITPNGGTVLSSQKIAITCATEGAEINYIIDDGSSTKYTVPLTITKNCTLKVTASKLGWNNSDLVTATFVLTLNPELEVSGSLPSTALSSPPNNTNYAATLGTKGNTISVVRTDSENTEIGTVVVNATNYIANIPIGDTNYTAILVIKDNMGRILFRNILGKTLTKAEIPASTSKIKISGVNIDSTSTAMALLVKEKNIEVGKITSVTSTDLQNGIATKISNISNEITQIFSSNPTIINEVAKAVNTVTTAVLSTSVNTTIVPTNISTATELLSSFVKVIKEPTLQVIISQAQLSTSVTISTDQKIDSSTGIIEPILKVKPPIFSINAGVYNTIQDLTISCSTSGATIKYTLDGTIPSSINGLIYNSTISVQLTTTINAIALKSDMMNSEISTANFTIMQKTSNPVISPNETSFNSSQQITITCETLGAIIYYTLDNTLPTSSSTRYELPFTISSTKTIKAIAIKNGMLNSDIISKEYKLTSSSYIGMIVFNSFRGSNGEIYVMNPDGSNQTPITFNSTDDVFPSWSPDGSKIAFVSVRNGNPEIYTMDSNGSNQKQLTFSTQSNCSSTYPKWSPDGSKIVYESNKSGNFEIWVANFTGTQSRLTFNNASSRTPCWSPDGLRIAFTSNINGYHELYIMNSDGTNMKQITNNKAGCLNPSWSPDGQKILFSSNKDTYDYYEIYVIDLNTNLQTKLTNLNYTSKFPEWSPDGSKILFSSLAGSSQNIYVMDNDGKNINQLTNSSFDYYASWSNINNIENLVSTVEIKSDANLISTGQSIQLLAYAKDLNGNLIEGKVCQWYSSNYSIVTVSSNGLITGKSVGKATISVTIDNITQKFLINIKMPDFTYTDNGSDITITKCNSTSTTVIIPETINGKPVKSIGSAFGFITTLTSVIIPNSITSIGKNAFYCCANLTNINIPASVISIGPSAFGYCDNLTCITVDNANPNYSSEDGVLYNKNKTTLIQFPGGKSSPFTIPTSVSSIEEFAFSRCNNLSSITIPDNVTFIGIYAFTCCKNLTNVNIGKGITKIGIGVFNGTNLSSINIPSNISIIDNGSFSECNNLTNIIIPNSVSIIENYAFYHCIKLTSVTIPSSVTTIKNYAFGYCGLSSAYFNGNVPTTFEQAVFGDNPSTFKIYYIEGKSGWTKPTWKIYNTATFIPGQ